MATPPFDTLETCVNTARVRLNDAIASLAGDILTDSAAFTLTAINAAWRRFQERSVNYGTSWFTTEVILPSVPLVTSTDTGTQVWFNWANYFDGTANQSAPVLPQNFIAPEILWERATSTAPTGSFFPMDRMLNGLPAIPKLALNKSWEWRNGTIYMPGAIVITDIRMRFAAFLADFVAPGTTPFASQPVPVLRALNPFAWLICSEVAKSRGDLDAAQFDQAAEDALMQLFNLDPQQSRSIGNSAEYGKMPDRFTPNAGPAGPRGTQPPGGK